MSEELLTRLLDLLERFVVTREEEVDILRNQNAAMTGQLGDLTGGLLRAIGQEDDE